MKKLSYILLFSVFVAIFYACGGGGGTTGNISLYATDDISKYKQAAANLNSVSLVQSGTGAECFLLNSPEALNIADLSNKILFLDVASCPAGQYNRIHVVIGNTATLTDENGATSTCTFTSYKDNSNHPDVLNCSGITNSCTLDVNGAVNVFAGKNGKEALDFNLKDFEVANFPGPNCTITMKISPLNASDMGTKKENGYLEAITGDISNLNTNAKTFVITRGSAAFTVNYSTVNQAELDQLLLFAVNYHLKVRLVAASIDLNSILIPSEIAVKAEGFVFDLNTAQETFTLMMTQVNIGVDYNSAVVEGTLANGVSAEANLTGINGGNYIASKVEAGQVHTDD